MEKEDGGAGREYLSVLLFWAGLFGGGLAKMKTYRERKRHMANSLLRVSSDEVQGRTALVMRPAHFAYQATVFLKRLGRLPAPAITRSNSP